ncbi:MAG: hypothetical protein ABTQ73_02450 [Caldilineales bacterium]
MNDEKFHNKYRIPSTRLATWDYGSNAAYFVTICTHDRRHAFGRVLGGQVELSPLGEAAWDCWRAIPDHFPFAIADAFVAMPNHVHGIVIIDKPADGVIAGTQNIATTDAGTQNIATTDVVETQDLASLRRHPPQPMLYGNRFGPQSQNLASIIRGFKIGVTKFARQHQIPFAWQDRYHDHIIRDTGGYDRIRTYIVENPLKWSRDRFHLA